MFATEIIVSEYLASDIGENEFAAVRREAISLLTSNVLALQRTFRDVTVDLHDYPTPVDAPPGHFQICLLIRSLNMQIVLSSADERLLESVALTMQAQISTNILSLNHLAKIRQAKREWEVSADLLNDEIYLIDAQLRIHRLNRAAAAMVGTHPKDIVGKYFPSQLTGGHNTLLAALPAVPNEPRMFTLEVEGEFFQCRLFQILWAFNRTGYILIRSRITDDIKSQKIQLRSARLAGVGQVSIGLAHELNNPLGVILAAAGSLQRRYGADPQLLRFVEIISSEVERCRRITHALLDYGRTPDRDGTMLHLAHLLAQVPARLQATHPGCSIRLNLEGTGGVFGNEDDLMRLFSNLTANAIEAAGPGESIEISLTESLEHVLVTVSNPGSEIDANILQKMFEPFFTTKPQGTGLGLAFALKIVELMQGQLWHSREAGRNFFHVKLLQAKV